MHLWSSPSIISLSATHSKCLTNPLKLSLDSIIVKTNCCGLLKRNEHFTQFISLMQHSFIFLFFFFFFVCNINHQIPQLTFHFIKLRQQRLLPVCWLTQDLWNEWRTIFLRYSMPAKRWHFINPNVKCNEWMDQGLMNEWTNE